MAKYFYKDGDEFKEVEDTLFSQNELETTILPKRLERERNKFADYEALKEKANKVDTLANEYENKLKEKDTKIGELSGEVKRATLETDKVKIIHEFKLSNDASEFITGDSVDEMRSRAEKLSKVVPGGTVVVNKEGKPNGDEKTSDSKKIAKNLFGKRSDD